MEKTEMMKQIEREAELTATIQTGTYDELPRWWYVLELERRLEKMQSKAEAYDRLMSGGKKTPKEVANFLGNPIAMDRVGAWYEYKSKPLIGEGYCEDMWVSDLTGNDYVRLISVQIDFTGDWKDSLTMPDGWREK